MNVKRLLVLCLAAPALIALVYCGGSSSTPPTTPAPAAPAATPAPAPTFAPLSCDPTPPPLHTLKVKIHSNSGFRKTMDSRPLVEDVDGYCKRTGQSGRFCFTRIEGDPQQADCDRMAMGMADTGRYGPTWAFEGMPCTDGGAPVTMERLFGLVKAGTTPSASRTVPLSRTLERNGMAPAFMARSI